MFKAVINRTKRSLAVVFAMMFSVILPAGIRAQQAEGTQAVALETDASSDSLIEFLRDHPELLADMKQEIAGRAAGKDPRGIPEIVSVGFCAPN